VLAAIVDALGQIPGDINAGADAPAPDLAPLKQATARRLLLPK
jgi:hypothetical protein